MKTPTETASWRSDNQPLCDLVHALLQTSLPSYIFILGLLQMMLFVIEKDFDNRD